MTKYRVGSRLVFEVTGHLPGTNVMGVQDIAKMFAIYGETLFLVIERPVPVRPVDASDAKRLADNVAMIDVSGHVKGCGCRICEVVAMAKEIQNRLEA